MALMLLALPGKAARRLNDPWHGSVATRSCRIAMVRTFSFCLHRAMAIPFLRTSAPCRSSTTKYTTSMNSTSGLLLGANGLLIFSPRCPPHQILRGPRVPAHADHPVQRGAICLSFVVLNVSPTILFLWVGVLMTVGEMLNFLP